MASQADLTPRPAFRQLPDGGLGKRLRDLRKEPR
jgi:hypothetical protein